MNFILDFNNNISDNVLSVKKIILEPITCIFRIILLKYKENNTKISINNNSIQYIYPIPFQGVIRTINGDNRNDLHNIYNPLIKSMNWLPLNDLNKERNMYFFQESIYGLEKLIECYDKDTLVNHTLKHYIAIINNYICNSIIEDDLNKTPLIEHFKDFWKNEELNIIFNKLQFINNSTDKEIINIYVNSIEIILDYKESKIKEYIEVNSKTYQ